MQPIRRFGFDAAILFSDILVLPDALGQSVGFETGDGPRLDPIGDAEGLAKLSRRARLEPACAGVRGSRPPQRRAAQRNGADRLLRRAMDGGELYDRWPGNARSGAGAPLRLPPSGPVRAPDRPARRRFGRIPVPSIRGGGGSGADLRFLGGRAAADRIRTLVRRADRSDRGQGSRRRRRTRR